MIFGQTNGKFLLSNPNLEFLETIKLVFASNLTITFEIILKFS